jgi:nicotinamidase-related amidase
VIAGLTTECCVADTAKDAFNRDYHVFVAADACAAYEPDLQALKMLDLNTAILTDSASVAGAWERLSVFCAKLTAPSPPPSTPTN